MKIANTCKTLAERKQKNVLAAPSVIIYLSGTCHLCLEPFRMFPIEYVRREKFERSTLGLNVEYSEVQTQNLANCLFGGPYI